MVKKSKKNDGFIKQMRSPEVDELLRDPYAFVLLTQIARRSRRTNSFNLHKLEPGEALIGDYQSVGLTEAKYRAAKRRLSEYGLATFKATNRGTIANLTNSVIYDVNVDGDNDQDDRQTTKEQRSNNDQDDRQTTTNKNVKNVKNVKNEREGARANIQKMLNNFPKPDLAKPLFEIKGFTGAFVDYWLQRKTQFSQWPNEFSVVETYRRLNELLDQGQNIIEVLRQSTRNGNKELYPVKDFDKKTPSADDWDQDHLKRPMYKER